MSVRPFVEIFPESSDSAPKFPVFGREKVVSMVAFFPVSRGFDENTIGLFACCFLKIRKGLFQFGRQRQMYILLNA